MPVHFFVASRDGEILESDTAFSNIQSKQRELKDEGYHRTVIYECDPDAVEIDDSGRRT